MSTPIRSTPGPWSEAELRRMPTQGFQQALGIVLDQIAPHLVTAHIEIALHHMNSGGAIHGGVLMALADSLGAIGALQHLGPDQCTATLESKTNFVRPCSDGKIFAECRPLHLGGRTSVWHTTVSNNTGNVTAHIWQTQLHIDGKNARPG